MYVVLSNTNINRLCEANTVKNIGIAIFSKDYFLSNGWFCTLINK